MGVPEPGLEGEAAGCRVDRREQDRLVDEHARRLNHLAVHLRLRNRGDREVVDRVALGGAAFGRTALSVPRYQALRAGPGYDASLDVVAVDARGRLAAFCLAWHDPITRTGELEPIGCHPDHRRRGLARAVIQEALARLRERNADQVVVYTGCANRGARALYEALGFRVIGEDYDYAKPLS